MTSTSSKLDAADDAPRPYAAPRHPSKKPRHADQPPIPYEPHQNVAVHFDDLHPKVDDAAAAKARRREQRASRREAKKARRAARISMAAAAAAAPPAILVLAPQTAMTTSASPAAQQGDLDAGSSQPNSSRDNGQAVTALPGSVAPSSQGALKMAEVCKEPVDCDAAGTAPATGCMASHRIIMPTASCTVASVQSRFINTSSANGASALLVEGSVHVQCRSVKLFVLVELSSSPVRQIAVFAKFKNKAYF